MYNTQVPNRSELPTSRQLLLSTFIAAIVAAALLVTVVLPAEYGIDPTHIGQAFGLTQMGKIKMAQASGTKRNKDKTAPQNAGVVSPKTDETTISLKPGEAIEIKMEMAQGATVKYEWSATGPVNHDTHGEADNEAVISYKKETGVDRDAGELTAEFDGIHGWYWRNRGEGDVSITLKTSGEYSSIKQIA